MTLTVILILAYIAGGLIWAAVYAIQADIKQEPLTYGGVLGEGLAWPYRIYLKFKG